MKKSVILLGLFCSSLFAGDVIITPGGGSGSSDAAKLQGKEISTNTPTTSQALVWNDTIKQWVPTSISVASTVSDTAYDATSWDGVTTFAPSKNAVRDKIETLGTAAYTASTAYDVAGAATAILASPTFTGTVTTPNITLSGNQSAAAWTTSGLRLKGISGTLTDTTSSGTVAAAYTNKLGGNTIAASSATTFTDYISTYFSEPVAGTNVTLTNKWALGADSLYVGTSNPFKVTSAGAVTAASTIVSSTAGAASAPALKLSGVPFAGTGTTSFPLVYLNDSNATASTTLATAGTYLGVNGHGTADLANFMLDGASKVKITSAGSVTLASGATLSTSGGSLAGSVAYNGYTAQSNDNTMTLQGRKFSSANTAVQMLSGATASDATSGQFNGVAITPVYNQASGSAANTDLLVNRTQTAIGSGAQTLLDLQVANSSKFSVSNTGLTTIADTTDSTTSTTGSLKTAGGLGVAKAANVGTTLTVGSTINGGTVSDATPVRVYVKNVTILTSGTPADIATITLPASLTRYTASSSAGAFMIVAETASGTLAAANVTPRDTSAGGGNPISTFSACPASAATITSSVGATAVYTSGTIYLRQTSNSANAGTCSFYINLLPIP